MASNPTNGNVQTQWAWAKVARADQHLAELAGRISLWRAASPPEIIAEIADSRLAWEARLNVPSPMPLEELALIMGDVVHNLRSALDVLVWANTDTATLSDRQMHQVSFPLATDPSKWGKKSSEQLRSVLPIVIDRIKALQPFNRPETARLSDALLLLHGLDNRDKHRLSLSTEATAQIAAMSADQSIEYHDEAALQRNLPPVITAYEHSLEDGVVLLSGTANDPIKSIKGRITLQYQLSIMTDRGLVDAMSTLAALSQYVREVIFYVQTGETVQAQATSASSAVDPDVTPDVPTTRSEPEPP